MESRIRQLNGGYRKNGGKRSQLLRAHGNEGQPFKKPRVVPGWNAKRSDSPNTIPIQIISP